MSLKRFLSGPMALGLTLMAIVGAPRAAAADPGCGCDPVVAPCSHSCVQKVVMVPQWTTEKRIVTCTQYVPQVREQLVTRYKRVTETQQVERQYTVMVQQPQTRSVTQTVYKPVYETKTRQCQVQVPVWTEQEQQYTCQVPVYETVDKQYTVMVPHQEKRAGTRKVCKIVPVQEVRKVTCDEGHWDSQMVEVPCRGGCCRVCGRRCRFSGCGCCDQCTPATRTVCRKVWVANLVTREVPVTVCKTVVEDVPYECMVTVCRPEVRTCKERVCHYKTEIRTRKVRVCSYRTESRPQTYQTCKMVPQQVTRQVTCMVCVPKTVTRTCPVTTCKMVPIKEKVRCTIMVPKQVQKEVCVPVCKMVPQTISVAAPRCGPARCRLLKVRSVGCCEPCNGC